MTNDDRYHWIAYIKYKLAVALALSSVLGCYQASDGPGSGETHFLRGCSEDGGCASGLECVCGVCTMRCDDNNTCKDQSEIASCRPSDCSEERICDVECAEDGDCADLGSTFGCEDGQCRPVATDPIVADIAVGGDFDASGDDIGDTIDSGSSDERTSSDSCELEDGYYQPTYEMLNGTCGSPPIYRIPIKFHDSDLGRWSLDEIQMELKILTEIAYQGCTLEITQRVSRDDVLIFRLQGTVEIENEERLAGEVFIEEFEDQTKECEGYYEVILTDRIAIDI